MPGYKSEGYDPPAPVAYVTIKNPQNGKVVNNVEMLLDTGSDITLVTRDSIDFLSLAPKSGESYMLMGFDGKVSEAEVVELDMIFLQKVFRGRYLIVDKDTGIIGRDILNLVSLFLNGPNLFWNETQ